METDLYKFADCRTFLRSHFVSAKARNPRWSYRAWALKLGRTSPSTLAMVLKGDRNVGMDLSERLIQYFKFREGEREYFLNLVRSNLARGSEKKQENLSVVLRPKSSPRKLDSAAPAPANEAAFTWHFFALREMTLLKGFSEEPSWIRRSLRFPLTDAEIAASLGALVDLGFLKRNSQGKLIPAEGTLEADLSGHQSQQIRNYHRQLVRLSAWALESDQPVESGYFSSTITFDPAKFEFARERIRRFQKELSELLEDGQEGKATYIFNFHAFPLARIPT